MLSLEKAGSISYDDIGLMGIEIDRGKEREGRQAPEQSGPNFPTGRDEEEDGSRASRTFSG